MSRPESEGLRRSLGLADVIALGVNGVVGSGIFLLPGLVDELMGPAALLASVFAGVLCFLIALCFAEVGSHFSSTGGPYAYAREAFGDLVGFEVGWMAWWIRIISWAALANAFTIAAEKLLPGVGHGLVQKLVIVGLMGGLAMINLRGVERGALFTDIVTVAKLLPLFVLVVVGAFFVDGELFEPFAPQGYGGFSTATLTILWAFVGFEILVIPAGEMRQPQRSVPIALVSVMSLVTLLYLGIQVVTIGTVAVLAGAANPVADAGGVILGPVGGAIVAGCVVLSILGSNASSALVTPRVLFALGEKGQLPSICSRVHPEYATPAFAIVVSTALAMALALTGTFQFLAVVSVVARFVQYIPTILAVFVFRRRRGPESEGSGYRIPGGPLVPVLALVLSVGLVAQAGWQKLLAGAVLLLLGLPFYFFFRARRAEAPASRPLFDVSRS